MLSTMLDIFILLALRSGSPSTMPGLTRPGSLVAIVQHAHMTFAQQTFQKQSQHHAGERPLGTAPRMTWHASLPPASLQAFSMP